MKVIKISIASSNKERSLTDIANVINDVIFRLPSHINHMQFATLHDIKPNLYKSELPTITKKPPDNAFHIQFFLKID